MVARPPARLGARPRQRRVVPAHKRKPSKQAVAAALKLEREALEPLPKEPVAARNESPRQAVERAERRRAWLEAGGTVDADGEVRAPTARYPGDYTTPTAGTVTPPALAEGARVLRVTERGGGTDMSPEEIAALPRIDLHTRSAHEPPPLWGAIPPRQALILTPLTTHETPQAPASGRARDLRIPRAKGEAPGLTHPASEPPAVPSVIDEPPMGDRRPEGAVPLARSDIVRPSAMEKGVLCPGSIPSRMGFPKRPAGPEALSGIFLHTVCERVGTQRGGLSQTPEEMLAYALELGATAVEFWDVVFPMMEFCQRKIVAHGEAGDVPEGEDVTRYASDYQFECHFKHKSLGFEGTCDFIVHFPRTDQFPPRVVVADLKAGVGVPVTARGNIQLRSYAGLMAHTLANTGKPLPEDTILDLWIIQPRSATGRKFTHERLTMEDLRRFWAELIGALAAAAATPKDRLHEILVPGPPCRYCEAAAGCPAAAAVITAVIEDNDPVHITQAPVEVLLRHLENYEQGRPAFENLRVALNTVLGSVDVPGWSVQRRRGRTMYRTDKEPELRALLRALGKRLAGKVTALYEPAAPMSPAVLRKHYPDAYHAAVEAGLTVEASPSFSPVRDTPSGRRKEQPPAERGDTTTGFDSKPGLKE